MITVGNAGYRWQGYNTRVIDNNMVSLHRIDSYIIIPAKLIKGNCCYRITINAVNSGGNGKLILKVEGAGGVSKEKYVYVKNKNYSDYKILIDVMGFKDQKDVALKIYRSSDSSGNVLINAVSCDLVKEIVSEVEIERNKVEKYKLEKLER